MLDAVFLAEPGVLEARQRMTLRMRAAPRRLTIADERARTYR